MAKPNIRDFLSWGLPHATPNAISDTAVFPIPRNEIGTDPAHYLLGTIWTKCTRANIKAVWAREYQNKYTWDYFDDLTRNWQATERATDCGGYNDAFLRYVWEGGDHTTDYSADSLYRTACTEKGEITDYKALPLGAAVFKQSVNDKGQKYMSHVGYICGFDGDEPLVMEAQGLNYGCRINYLSKRTVFKFYGIMDKIYEYAEPMPDYPAEPELITKGAEGEAFAKLQDAMNWLGYKDDEGKTLVVDGKCGKRTMQAWSRMMSLNAQPVESSIVTLTIDDQVVYTAEV